MWSGSDGFAPAAFSCFYANNVHDGCVSLPPTSKWIDQVNELVVALKALTYVQDAGIIRRMIEAVNPRDPNYMCYSACFHEMYEEVGRRRQTRNTKQSLIEEELHAKDYSTTDSDSVDGLDSLLPVRTQEIYMFTLTG